MEKKLQCIGYGSRSAISVAYLPETGMQYPRTLLKCTVSAPRHLGLRQLGSQLGGYNRHDPFSWCNLLKPDSAAGISRSKGHAIKHVFAAIKR